jgi:hypothetical protein
MARAITEIEDEIRRLPAKAQERLLHVLLEELDGPPIRTWKQRGWRKYSAAVENSTKAP